MKLKHLRLLPVLIAALGFVLLLNGCSGKKGSSGQFNLPVYTPSYASGFEIKGAEGKESTLLEVRNPWQGAEGEMTQLLILRNGESVPSGFAGQILNGEAKRVVAMSSTQVGMLDAIGASGCVAGVSGLPFIHSERIHARGDSVADVGYEGNIDYERLLALKPDIVLLYGVNSRSSMEGKLADLGIPFVYVGDYLEESPLGKAEWMVALGEILGERELAIQLYQEIPRRYADLRARVANASGRRPKVMLNAPYNDAWFMPPAGSYAVRLVSDAGGEVVYTGKSEHSSEPIDLEEAYLLASRADIWINPGSTKSLEELLAIAPKFAGVECVRRGEVYNNNRLTNAAGGNDYFESAVVHPDLVLRDLVSILHPEILKDTLTYYQKLR